MDLRDRTDVRRLPVRVHSTVVPGPWSRSAAIVIDPVTFADQPLSAPIAPVVPRRAEVLGIPLAVSDYREVLDWMDATIASGGRAYMTAAAVNLVMSAREDPAIRAATLDATLAVPDGQPLVWALRALGHRRGDARLRARPDGASLRALRALGHADLPLRRTLAGGAAAAHGAPARALSRAPVAGGHSPPFRALTASRARAVVARHRPFGRGRRVGRHRPAQAGAVDARDAPALAAPLLVGVGAAFDFHAGIVPQAPAVDAASRTRVDLPPGARAAPAVAALRPPEPPLPGRVPRAVPARASLTSAHAMNALTAAPRSQSWASGAWACRSRWPSPTAA